MAPIRRYLRISRYSVLEVRIYLEQPSLADSWLLAARSPALPRIISAIRPFVLPKLREENENAKKKGGKKKKSTKDTVTKEDFEVAIFLTESGSRHAILTKDKSFAGKGRDKERGRSGIGKYLGGQQDPVVLREESSEEVRLEDIPAAPNDGRGTDGQPVDVSSDEEDIAPARNGRKRKRQGGERDEAEDGEDEKKKLGMKTEYEGFAIYGRILCLIVKRKGVKARAEAPVGSSQMLENWVSTQVDKDGVGMDDDG
ncbi:hypothetical protein CAC42_6768 [Sphaceloma murrayae]|uniref:Uncharacterized protein n=1 Tax=Sphaceloma murrayae TaxID=2082308 RepID=A0A2K1QGG7_9PEZI|nr:hypothetical protein CAC42_6768 [Sphaceloma murrayae]